MFKVNSKTTERRLWRCSGVFIVNFEEVNFSRVVFNPLGTGVH